MAKKFGFDLLEQQLLDQVRSDFEWFREETKGDSEIEKLFYVAFVVLLKYNNGEYSSPLISRDEENEKRFLLQDLVKSNHVIVRSQAQIGDRRVDFLIHAYDFENQKWHRLIVECDGHDFHERTKEQAARDRARDRASMLDGYECFRFTGSELWRDPWGCADQVYEWAVQKRYGRQP